MRAPSVHRDLDAREDDRFVGDGIGTVEDVDDIDVDKRPQMGCWDLEAEDEDVGEMRSGRVELETCVAQDHMRQPHAIPDGRERPRSPRPHAYSQIGAPGGAREACIVRWCEDVERPTGLERTGQRDGPLHTEAFLLPVLGVGAVVRAETCGLRPGA